MKVFAAVLVGALAVISITSAQGTFVDPNAERAAQVAGYVACIGPCLQAAVTNPVNGPCHLSTPNVNTCMATLAVAYPDCVNKCTGWGSTTGVAAASLEDYEAQEAFELDNF